MAVRRTFAVVLAWAAAVTPALADKLDAESRKWLEAVGAIILPQEAKIYGQLKDRAERAEFERIFWARRDPDIRTPDNEAQPTLLARRAEADRRFAVAGQAGSATGCGRLFILLGEPDAVRDEAMGAVLGAPGSAFNQVKSGVERSSANEVTRLPDRQPQVWVYKDRHDVTFAGGEVKVAVDGRCAVLPVVNANLDRIAAGRIVNPGLAYKVASGRITRLAELMPKPTPAQELLATGRREIGIGVQVAFARAEGATAVIGLVRAETAGLSRRDAEEKGAGALVIVAHAVGEDGRIGAVDERLVTAPVPDEEAVLGSYRLFLRPGRYTLRSGVLDPKSGKGGVNSQAIEVPDLGGPDLSAGTLMVVKDLAEGARSDPADPLDAFVLGSLRLVPRFANAFTRGEAAHFVYGVNGSVDETTGKSNLTTSLSLLKRGTVVAETPPQSFTETHVLTSVGPVDLTFDPGGYTARLKVTDALAHKELTVDAPFTIR